MPLYEYQCQQCGHRFEKIQSFSAPDEKACPVCGGAVERLISAPAIQFKGAGWYVNDYAGRNKAPSAGASSSESGDKSGSNSGSTEASASKSSDASSGASSAASGTSSTSSSSNSGGSSSTPSSNSNSSSSS